MADDERCPRCSGPMDLVRIDGHDSWACPVDAYAYAVDQSDDLDDLQDFDD